VVVWFVCVVFVYVFVGFVVLVFDYCLDECFGGVFCCV